MDQLRSTITRFRIRARPVKTKFQNGILQPWWWSHAAVLAERKSPSSTGKRNRLEHFDLFSPSKYWYSWRQLLWQISQYRVTIRSFWWTQSWHNVLGIRLALTFTFWHQSCRKTVKQLLISSYLWRMPPCCYCQSCERRRWGPLGRKLGLND